MHYVKDVCMIYEHKKYMQIRKLVGRFNYWPPLIKIVEKFVSITFTKRKF